MLWPLIGTAPSLNDKWVNEGWICAGRGLSPGTATVEGLVWPHTPK